MSSLYSRATQHFMRVSICGMLELSIRAIADCCKPARSASSFCVMPLLSRASISFPDQRNLKVDAILFLLCDRRDHSTSRFKRKFPFVVHIHKIQPSLSKKSAKFRLACSDVPQRCFLRFLDKVMEQYECVIFPVEKQNPVIQRPKFPNVAIYVFDNGRSDSCPVGFQSTDIG